MYTIGFATKFYTLEDADKYYRVKATISHEEYKGQKQTRIQRIKQITEKVFTGHSNSDGSAHYYTTSTTKTI